MSTQTSRLQLVKPEPTENWSVQDHFNANMDRLEAEAVARNGGTVFSDTSLTMAQFIDICDAAMDDHPGIVDIGYVNAVVTTAWGLPFNGHVIGLVNGSAYRKILIINNANGMYIQSLSKSAGTWATEWRQVSAKPIDRYSGITWSTYATAENNTSTKIRLYKIGQMCVLSGYLVFNGTVPVETTLFTLPTDCRPIVEWRIIGHRPTGTDINQSRGAIITTEGNVYVHNGSDLTGSSTHYLNLSATWVTNE